MIWLDLNNKRMGGAARAGDIKRQGMVEASLKHCEDCNNNARNENEN